MGSSAKKITPEEVWEGINELRKAQKETDRQLKETDRQLKETDRQLKEMAKETDRQLKETNRQLRKTDARFNSQWGKLIESLVEGDLVKLFNQKKIAVQRTLKNARYWWEDKEYEFDIIAVNGEEVVVVEVKTTLRPNYVDHFIEKLENFKEAFPEYSNKVIYGAVAFIKADASSDKYSESKGLFVIRAVGSSSSIMNSKDFTPEKF